MPAFIPIAVDSKRFESTYQIHSSDEVQMCHYLVANKCRFRFGV
jgi:hypothetical protein